MTASQVNLAAVNGPTILTASGRYVYPLDLQPEDVCLEDIVHALAHQCRFSGHVRDFYSVAEHSVRVCWHLFDQGATRDVALWGLLHDAAEAYLVDLPRPLKQDAAIGSAYRAAEKKALIVIARAFGLPHEEPIEVREADLVLLATERRDLMPAVGTWDILRGVVPLTETIHPWAFKEARWEFQTAFDALIYSR